MRLLIMAMLAVSMTACSVVENGESTTVERPVRPNVLVLMAEDLSARVGVFGDLLAVTPNIDALAVEGVRFPNTFTTAGVCAPSRAAHITGMHQIAIGAQHMRTSLFRESPYRAVPPPDVKAYPELLRRAGYFTFTNRKLDYQFSSYAPGSGPSSIWDDESSEPDWSRRVPSQPFFGLVNLPQTHESQLFTRNFEKKNIRQAERAADPATVIVPPYYADTPTVRETIARQYDNVREMDRYVGDLLARLEAEGLLENTIVIWTTDHGDGLPRGKREIYDSGIKVPMIVHWPEQYRPDWVEPGGMDDRLISFVDLGPTVLELAGAAIPESMHGRPTLLHDDAKREYIYASKDRMDDFAFRERAVRDERYKYIRNFLPDEPGAVHLTYRDQLEMMAEFWELREDGQLNAVQSHWFDPRPAEELYDIQADPHETSNLTNSPDHNAVLLRMRSAMDDWLAGLDDHSDRAELEMAQNFWPNGEQPVTPQPLVLPTSGTSVELKPGGAGASMLYRVGEGPWRVHMPGTPVELPGSAMLTAKNVRYGWQESAEVKFTMTADTPFSLQGDHGLLTLSDQQKINIAISPRNGGELAGLKVPIDGQWRELIYRARNYGEHKGWRGKAQLLWPATGVSLEGEDNRDHYRLGDQTLAMPPHGFARFSSWSVSAIKLGSDSASVTIGFNDSDETRALYPFGFRTDAEYRVKDGTVAITYTVEADEDNDQVMPFSIGNHMTFRLPLVADSDPAATRFTSNTDKRFVTVEVPARVFAGEVISSPFKGEHLATELPRRKAVSLGGDAAVPKFSLVDPSGYVLTISHEILEGMSADAIDFNLWADLEDGFFSPEPWVGTQNALNSGHGLIRLAPGDRWRWKILIEPQQDNSGD